VNSSLCQRTSLTANLCRIRTNIITFCLRIRKAHNPLSNRTIGIYRKRRLGAGGLRAIFLALLPSGLRVSTRSRFWLLTAPRRDRLRVSTGTLSKAQIARAAGWQAVKMHPELLRPFPRPLLQSPPSAPLRDTVQPPGVRGSGGSEWFGATILCASVNLLVLIVQT
jgi:hypothetical protein